MAHSNAEQNPSVHQIVSDAIGLVLPGYRTPKLIQALEAWIEAHPLPTYLDRKPDLELAMSLNRSEVDSRDTRCEALFRVSTYRYRCECGDSIAEKFLDELSGGDYLEACIAFGYIALAWQVCTFPKDVILTAHQMKQRYPLQQANAPAISPC